MLPIAAHIPDKLRWIAADLVSRRVNENVRIFHDEREHLVEPWHANMATENAKLGKLQRDPIKIRDRPPWFRLAQWPCVSDLRAKWNVKLATLCKQRIVPAVVWRQTPNPGQNAQPFETVPLHPKPQLPHRFHGTEKINGRDTDEAIGICSTILCDLVVADHRAAWTVPRAEHTDGDARTIHLGKCVLDGRCCFRPLAGSPSTQRFEHWIPDPVGIRMLHPSINDHVMVLASKDRTYHAIACPPNGEGEPAQPDLVVVSRGHTARADGFPD